jgi:hypothetical protein
MVEGCAKGMQFLNSALRRDLLFEIPIRYSAGRPDEFFQRACDPAREQRTGYPCKQGGD